MAKVIEGTTALPLDRLYQKIENIEAATREDQEVWKSIAMFMGRFIVNNRFLCHISPTMEKKRHCVNEQNGDNYRISKLP